MAFNVVDAEEVVSGSAEDGMGAEVRL